MGLLLFDFSKLTFNQNLANQYYFNQTFFVPNFECHLLTLEQKSKTVKISGHQCFADLADVEHGWGFDIVPVFFGERVHNLLLGALFATLSEPFILADRPM